MSRLESALALRGLGWNVVAAPRGGKSPMGSWKRWQDEAIPERLVRETFTAGEHNLFVITGSVSQLAVLDCDDEASVEYWTDRLGDALKDTARVRTGKGYHFYFRLKPGQVERGRSSIDDSCKWDLRAEGGGVIAPPSVHKSGKVYRWSPGKGPDALQDAPAALFERAKSEGQEDQESPRSVLSHLVSNPPEGEGGRNNWLTKVAGHYARHFPFRDAYEFHVREAAAKLNPPLPEEEIEKMLESIWSSEQEKGGKDVPDVDEDDDEEAWRRNLLQPAEETGWLVSGKTCILAQVSRKTSQGFEKGLARWLDADIRVRGVVESSRGREYEVELLLPDGDAATGTLPASTVADGRLLATWLANHGCSIGPPDGISPKRMPTGTRLLRYLEAQDAEVLESVEALGWHDESDAFVTHEGLIRATGPAPFEHVRPEPSVREWAPYQYGHGGCKEAAAVLREVLGFHHQTVAAVFGSWWAACLLKPQIQEVASQFPFMALEAASESGKTTGFFSLMLQLSGNASGHSNPTRAALRDYLSAHRSGIVWVDDLDSLEAHGELLRNVTVGGALVKKGEGHHHQVVAHLRAALVVSGESLGLYGQKALLDRAILLEVPSPVGRKSKKTPDRPEWDDVLELRARHPDLTAFAGSIVELALNQADLVPRFKDLRPGAGRFADKLALLRLGARVLAGIAGKEARWVVDLVDAWTEDTDNRGAENALTFRLLPAALHRTGWKKRPQGPDPSRRQLTTPAFVEGEEGKEIVWFSPALLAEWWEQQQGRIDSRVESAEALTQQARALGMGGKKGPGGGRKLWRLETGEGVQIYWKVPKELSQTLLERSRGQSKEDVQDGDDEDRKLL